MSINDITSNPLVQDLGLGKPDDKKNSNKLGQEEFLDLMVAQLKNQDPFKPMENGDFIAQMAQFSSVSGLEELQSSFNTLANSLQSNQALQASTLVGRSVLVPSDEAMLTQTSDVRGVLDLPQGTPNVNVMVQDANGELVKQISLGSNAQGEVPFVWDGTDSNGERMPPGKYKLVAEAQGPEGGISVNTFVSADVESVTIGNGGQNLVLNLQDMGSVDFARVREIR
jgi:flagellar basal-body rod modification protein FlgD